MFQKINPARNLPQQTKNKLFRLFHHVIQGYSIPYQIYLILLIVETFQILFFSIYPKYIGLWTSSAIPYIQDIFGYTTLIKFYIKDGNIPIIICASIFLVLYGIILLIIIHDIFLNRDPVITQLTPLQNRRMNTFKSKYIQYIYIFSKTVMTIPILSLSYVYTISSSNNNNNTNNNGNNNSGSNTQFQSSQEGLIIVSKIVVGFAILFYLIVQAIYMAIVCNYSPFTKLLTSSRLSHNQVIKICGKIIMGIFGGFTITDQSSNAGYSAFTGFLLILFLYLLGDSFQQIYTDNISWRIVLCNKFYTYTLVNILWITLCSLINQLLTQSDNNRLIFLTIGIIPCNILWHRLKLVKQQQLILSDYQNISNLQDITNYNSLLFTYIHGMQSQDQYILKLQGIFQMHTLTCKKSQILCKCQEIGQKISVFHQKINKNDFSNIYDNSRISGEQPKDSQIGLSNMDAMIASPILTDKEQFKNAWYQFIKNNLQLKIVQYQTANTPQLLIYISYLEKQIFYNNFSAIKNIQKSQYLCGNLKNNARNNKKGSFKLQFIRYSEKRVIESIMKQEDIRFNQKNFINVNNFYQFEIGFDVFLEKIKSSALKHLEFWGMANTNKKNPIKVIEKSCYLYNQIKEIKSKFKALHKINQQNLAILMVYSSYSRMILNDPKTEEQITMKMQKIQRQLSKLPKFANNQLEKDKYSHNSDTTIMIISGQRMDLGTIKYATPKITKLFKYATYEVIGQSINALIPLSIGNIHNQILENFLDKGKSNLGNLQRLIPVIDKDNFMIISRMLVKTLPNLLNGLQLVGIMNRIKQVHPKHPNQKPKYILYRTDTGKIQAVSQSVSKEYGYSIKKVSQYSQVSQQLYFNSMLEPQDNQIWDNQRGYRAVIRSKYNNKKIDVQVYTRHEISYFGLNFKLMEFYLCSNSLTQYWTNNKISGVVNKQTMLSIHDIDITEKQIIRPIDESQQLLFKQKMFKIIQKKNKIDDYIPFQVKIFKIIIGLQIIAFAIFMSLQLMLFFNGLSFEQRLKQYTKIKSQLLENTIDLSYFSRLVQVSSNQSYNLPFYQYRSNISAISSKMQQNQFWMVNNQMQFQKNGIQHFQTVDTINNWLINENGEVNSQEDTISLTIFDLVTSSSTFNNAKPANFNFPLKLLQTNNFNSFFRNLFHIRYTTLFQLLDKKLSNWEFLSLNALQYTDLLLKESAGLFIAISIYHLIVFIILSICATKLMNRCRNALSFFNTILIANMQTQIQTCSEFVNAFYQSSYEVSINKKQKMRLGTSFNDMSFILGKNNKAEKFLITQNIVSAASNSSIQDNQQTQIHDDPLSNQLKAGSKNSLIEKQDENIKSLANMNPDLSASIDRKTVGITQQLFSKKNIEGLHASGQQLDEKSPIFNSGSYQMDEEQMRKSKDISPIKKKLIFLIAAFLLLLYVYFISELIRTLSIHQNRKNSIQINKIFRDNPLTLKALKLYGLESAIDDSPFKDYDLLSKKLMGTTEKMYEIQRNFNEPSGNSMIGTQIGKAIYQVNQENVCLNKFSDQLLLFPASSMSIQQCEKLQDEIFTKGLRSAVVSYIEKTIQQLPSNSIQFLQNDTLTTLIASEKYILNQFYFILELFDFEQKKRLSNSTEQQLVILGVYFIFAIVLVIGIYQLLPKLLISNIKGSIQLFNLIPIDFLMKHKDIFEDYNNQIESMYS